jgi:hypothetical protein
LAGVYFSETGDAVEVRAGGAINVTPSSGGVFGDSSSPVFYTAEVFLEKDGGVTLLIPEAKEGELMGAKMRIDGAGESARLLLRAADSEILLSR